MSKIEFIVLMYPNDTTVKIEGDPDIISQIIRQLDGQMIGFQVSERFDVTDGWNIDALRALMKEGNDDNTKSN